MATISLPKELVDSLGTDAIRSVIAGLREAPAGCLPAHGPWRGVNLSEELAAHARTMAAAAGVSVTSMVVKACEVVQPAVSAVAPPAVEQKAAAPLPPPKPTRDPRSKKQIKWEAVMERRLAIIAADIAVGRWGVYCIIGGSPSVDPMTGYSDSGYRDFGDEMASGLVVQQLIPWHYSVEEGDLWRRGQNEAGIPCSWWYITGDCESLSDAADAERRAAVRADKRLADAADGIDAAERRERLEVVLYGKKVAYIEAAARDALALGRNAPANLLAVVQDATARGYMGGEAQALLERRRVGKMLTAGDGTG